MPTRRLAWSGAEFAGKVASRQVARKPHALGGDDFIVHEMQPDHLGPSGISFIEVTANRVADHRAELVEVIGFGDGTYPPDRASRRIPNAHHPAKPDITLMRIEGHADTQALSERRALMVARLHRTSASSS